MFDTKLKESLLEVPDLPALLEELHTALDDEQRQRIHFREWLSEDIKVGVGDYIESVVIQGFKIPVLTVFDARANAEVLAGMMANAPQ